jgi:hypothetical protein
MPQHQFDDLVRVLARDAALPRRVLLRRVVAGLLGGGLVGRAGGAAAQPGCRVEGHPCEGNQVCCEGLVCPEAKGNTPPGNARRCVEDLGQLEGAVLPGPEDGEERDAGTGDPDDTRDRAPIVNTGSESASVGSGGVVDATTDGGAVIIGDVASGSNAGSGVEVADEETVGSGG